MGWSLGFDGTWQRDIGYGVPAICDQPDCTEDIHRGLAHVCGYQEPYGGEDGCGLYFCHVHGGGSLCAHCAKEDGETFNAKPDVKEWTQHKLNDPSWQEWRDENPGWVAQAMQQEKP